MSDQEEGRELEANQVFLVYSFSFFILFLPLEQVPVAIGTVISTQHLCGICHEPIVGSQIIATNCGHLFHQDCLSPSTRCPTCHSELSPSILALLASPSSVRIEQSPPRVEPIYCRGCGRLFTPRSESRNQAGYYRCEDCVGVEATLWGICPFT